MLVKRVVWFLCFMFLFLCVFLVLFLSTLKNSFVLFCFCVVVFFVTRLIGLLVYILWSFFLFRFCCFVLNFVYFCFFIPLKLRPPKSRTQQKPKKAKMQKNRTKKTVSAIVFTNSVLQFLGVGLKFSFFG